jgi:hypothetical protein
MSIEDMNLDQLDALQQDLMGQRREIQVKQRAVARWQTFRAAEEKVRKAAKDAGVEVQLLTPESIATKESVGTPGA